MKQVLTAFEWSTPLDDAIKLFQLAGIDTDREAELK